MRAPFSGVVVLCGLILAIPSLAQQPSSSPQTPPKDLPKLERFTTSGADSSADPCDDFYKYANGKWLAAHPIPADQVNWGVGNPLELWNETVLVQALEQTSADNPKRTPNEQKVEART
jgi:putative endopeptidase